MECLISWRKVAKWFALVSAGLVGLLALFVISFIWWRSWNPFIDDGPFVGVARKDCPERNPDQVFAIYGGNTLYVHDPQGKEMVPTVSLRNENKVVLWCVYATGTEQTAVQTLRFTDYKQFPFSQPRVRGYVKWTFGHEGMWWFISDNGQLNEYWYSW